MIIEARIAVARVRRSIAVKAAPDHAFELFTAHMGKWWQRDKSVGKSPIADVGLEPFVGGRWFEIGEDGTTCDWGRVLVWEPGRRLMLNWQLSAAFTYDPDLYTEVDIRFEPAAAGTLVTLEHRNLDAYGDSADAVRRALEAGWQQLLGGFDGYALS